MHLLHEAGFLTPSALHYVTNHGKVPMLNAARHTLTVTVNPRKTKCVSQHTPVCPPDLMQPPYRLRVVEFGRPP